MIFAFSLFYAAYQAEIIRAGIQSISSGQEEAAQALGMGYRATVFDIILPQAFRNTLPSTINQVVITFKETSIVTIIGFFEVHRLGLGRGRPGRVGGLLRGGLRLRGPCLFRLRLRPVALWRLSRTAHEARPWLRWRSTCRG